MKQIPSEDGEWVEYEQVKGLVEALQKIISHKHPTLAKHRKANEGGGVGKTVMAALDEMMMDHMSREYKWAAGKIGHLVAVSEELDAQKLKLGEQNHSPALWLGILMEEVGEVAKAIVQTESPGAGEKSSYLEVAGELVQVAAVAVAMRESILRNQLK